MGLLVSLLARGRTRLCMSRMFCACLARRLRVGFRPAKLFSNRSFRTSFTVDVKKSKAFLTATTEINRGGVPVLNVGANHLNFLTSISPSRVKTYMSRVFGRACGVSRHDLVRMDFRKRGRPRLRPCTLGRMTILGHSGSSVVSVQISTGKRRLTGCRTSKLVVDATANSANCTLDMKNPIVTPRDKAVKVAPMTSRDLGTEPMVLPRRARVALDVSTEDRAFLITVSKEDRTYPRRAGLRLQHTPCAVGIIRQHGRSFFKALERGLV